ncbi:MAG: rhodanese-like domain-containing protein, partial [Gammaproteobacteria bacterium]
AGERAAQLLGDADDAGRDRQLVHQLLDGLQVDPQRPVVCLCHHGMRSMQVASFLAGNGIRDVYNLSGGIDAWAREVDPSCATY